MPGDPRPDSLKKNLVKTIRIVAIILESISNRTHMLDQFGCPYINGILRISKTKGMTTNLLSMLHWHRLNDYKFCSKQSSPFSAFSPIPVPSSLTPPDQNCIIACTKHSLAIAKIDLLLLYCTSRRMFL